MCFLYDKEQGKKMTVPRGHALNLNQSVLQMQTESHGLWRNPNHLFSPYENPDYSTIASITKPALASSTLANPFSCPLLLCITQPLPLKCWQWRKGEEQPTTSFFRPPRLIRTRKVWQRVLRVCVAVWHCSWGDTNQYLLTSDKESTTEQSKDTTKVQLCEPVEFKPV